MSDLTTDERTDEIASLRQWRDDWRSAGMRHAAMAADAAALWAGVDALLAEFDRRINPDDLDDEQTAVYEAGYVAGQKAVADRLRRIARELDG